MLTNLEDPLTCDISIYMLIIIKRLLILMTDCLNFLYLVLHAHVTRIICLQILFSGPIFNNVIFKDQQC